MHQPVLLKETVDLLGVRADGRYVDGTLGSGGHTTALLERVGADGLVVGIDRDGAAIERVRDRLAGDPALAGVRCELVRANFSHMADIAREHGVEEADGVILDLGVSSEQLEAPGRGFSFLHDGPLDMRMDQSGGVTAADLVNEMDENSLSDLIFRLGEERMARRIARAVVAARKRMKIETTGQLAEIVDRAAGGRKGRLHPATRTFQALRIHVNDEMESLRQGIGQGLALLAPGGRMAIISFHSLEDRIVKQTFQRHVGRWESLQAGGRRWVGELPRMDPVTRKPVMASTEEREENPRSRSAKLRVVERISSEKVGSEAVDLSLLQGDAHGAP